VTLGSGVVAVAGSSTKDVVREGEARVEATDRETADNNFDFVSVADLSAFILLVL
jgi:hypothetical protein